MNDKQFSCPLCNTPLVMIPGVDQWYCPECKRGFTAEELKSGPRKVFYTTALSREAQEWARDIAQDRNLWYEDAFELLPSVLAHEYHRLRELFSEGFIFGAILQIKDAFEVIVKFSVSVALAQAVGMDKEEEVREVLESFFAKPLSFGHWMEALRNLQGKSRQNPSLGISPFVQFPKKLQRYLNAIVSWRNEEVGHGALSMADDAKMRKDIEEKLDWLKQVMEHCLEAYSGYQLVGENLVFRGWQVIRSLHEDSEKTHREEIHPLFLRKEDEIGINLFPFMRLQTCDVCGYKDVFFFDSVKGKKHGVFLDYAYGHKIRRSFSMEKELRHFQQKLSIVPLDEDTVESDIIRARLDEIVQKITLDDFRKPTYLVDWLNRSMGEHEKGIFLLQMGAGMGKTVFVKALDPFGLQKLKLAGNYHLACYYIDNVYRFKLAPFVFELSDRIKRTPEGNLLLPLEMSPPSLSIEKDDKTPSEVFVEWLAFYVSAMQRTLGYDGVLVVIDALDEIPAHALSDRNILDFIPKAEDLPKGAYVLLTSRISEEIHLALKDRIRGLDITASLKVTPGEDSNKNLLSAYLEKELKDVLQEKKTRQSLIPEILKKGENRFLYVSHIKDLIMEGNLDVDDVMKLPPAETLYSEYLEVLEKVYPPKFLEGIKNILLALATAFDPVTLDELAYIVGEDRINFRFLGYLKDLKKMLRIERSIRGNLFSLAHDELKLAVRNRWEKELSDFLKRFLNQGLVDILEGERTPGMVYLSSNYMDYLTLASAGTNEERFVNNKMASRLFDIACDLYNEPKSVFTVERVVKICGECIEIRERLLNQSKLLDENDLALVHMNRGNALSDIHQIARALEDYNQAIEIMERLQKEGKLLDENNFAPSYMIRGNALLARGEIVRATEDYERAITIQKQLLKQGKYWIRAQLFMTYYSSLHIPEENSSKLVDFSARALSAAQEALQDEKLTIRAYSELVDLAQLATDHPSLPEEHKEKWREIYSFLTI